MRSPALWCCAVLVLAFGCDDPNSCPMPLRSGSPGDEAELHSVQNIVQAVFADAGYPVSATCSIFRNGSVRVQPMTDGTQWTDDKLLDAQPFLSRVTCPSSPNEGGEYRFIVSRPDFRNSELPVQMEYALTACTVGPDDGGWWGDWDQMAADALVAAHGVRPISGATSNESL